MTDALLRLSCAVRKAAESRKPLSEELRLELRRALIAAVPELLDAPPGSPPLDQAAAALRACHEAGVPLARIAELQFGASSLVSLMERG